MHVEISPDEAASRLAGNNMTTAFVTRKTVKCALSVLYQYLACFAVRS